jgi:hypothetical protein
LESDVRVDSRGMVISAGEGSTAGESAYKIDRDHVREFITFLRACGGFEIF